MRPREGALFLYFSWVVYGQHALTYEALELTEQQTRCLSVQRPMFPIPFEPGTASPRFLEDLDAVLDLARREGVTLAFEVTLDPFEVATADAGAVLAAQRAEVLRTALRARGVPAPAITTRVVLGPREMPSVARDTQRPGLGWVGIHIADAPGGSALRYRTGPGAPTDVLGAWLALARAQDAPALRTGLHAPRVHVEASGGLSVDLPEDGELAAALHAELERACGG